MAEQTSKNIDRLVTVGTRWGGRADRWIIVPLYESASSKLNGQPISFVAAQSIIDKVKSGDSVLLINDFASYPAMPFGETDGPLGVASLARTIRFGLGATPIIITGPRHIEATRATIKAAGLNITDYELARETSTAAAAEVTFPCFSNNKSKAFATNIMDEYSPKAVIAVEAQGPNHKGIRHFAVGKDMEAKDKLACLEYLFYEAKARNILTIGIIDQGNEIGSGTIEEDIRRIVPYGDLCQCPCKSGIACSVKTDIVFPANISNWGAYAISAMLAVLLGKADILQDTETEYRMLEACIYAGACDGPTGKPIMLVDAVNHEANEGLVSLLNCIVRNDLMGIQAKNRV